MENTVKYWTHLQQYREAAGGPRFTTISRLAIELYSLPYSNVEVEGIFSKMNYFKNIFRNTMASPTTEALIRIDGSTRWKGKECHNFNVTNEAKKKLHFETIYRVKPEDDFLLQGYMLWSYDHKVMKLWSQIYSL